MFDELVRQEVEQLWMRGTFSLQSKVVRRADDAGSHVMLPESVDQHSSQQSPGTLIGIGHPVGQ